MTPAADAASCAAFATRLRSGASLLRQSDGPDEPAPDLQEAARLMDDLAAALAEFATAVRDPRPPRPGRPHPHTALRAALTRIRESAES